MNPFQDCAYSFVHLFTEQGSEGRNGHWQGDETYGLENVREIYVFDERLENTRDEMSMKSALSCRENYAPPPQNKSVHESEKYRAASHRNRPTVCSKAILFYHLLN